SPSGDDSRQCHGAEKFDAPLGGSYSARMATKTSPSSAVAVNRRGDRVVTSNRRAFHDFHILETIEAGLVLTGTEIKSIRDGKATIAEAYARVEDGELWLIGSNVAPYSHGNRSNHDPDRPRKLLVHRRELERLRAAVEQRGLTLIPLRLHLKQGRAKLDVGVARGKKLYDKRAVEADRQSRRDVERALRERR
ncbi:MAG: SsrA-binding protein SmpB, partial [Thermomicrobiales bacterium]